MVTTTKVGLTGRTLSPEIVSLIHHVELNEAGWWKKANGQVLQGVLWKAQAPQTVTEIQATLRHEIGHNSHSEKDLTALLESLSGAGVVSRLPGPKYKLTERAFRELSVQRQEALAEHEACEKSFLTSCEEHCPELDATVVWTAFGRALSSAIQVMGANFYHLLADGRIERDVDWLADFLSKFEDKNHEGLRHIIAGFFDHTNSACRNQVLRRLTAHFYAEATQLTPETLASINNEKKKLSLKLVLDTNFVFSVLQLHDNPADDAVLSLIEIAKEESTKLELKLYVLPGTLEEAQRVLANQVNIIHRVRTTAAIAQAAVSQPLPSIARKYFEAARNSPGLTPVEFFRPYIDDLKLILHSKGIGVLEAHPSIYNQRQDVVDDVLGEVERESTELDEPRRKGYHTLLHDVVLWHAVNDKRSTGADSPLEIEYWAISIDWRLVAFDRFKRYVTGAKVPVVLHPSNLVQLIQFWIPRSAKLEESLVDSLSVPLFFQAFDPEDERATIQVLLALSRVENIGDFDDETLKVLLANRALRQRLRNSNEATDEALELVREELLSHHNATVEQLKEERDEAKRLAEALSDSSQRAVRAETRATDAEQLTDTLKGQHEASLQEASAAKAQAQGETNRANAAEQQLTRQNYAVLFFVLPLILGPVIWYYGIDKVVAAIPVLGSGWRHWTLTAVLLLFPIGISMLLSPAWTYKSRYLESWYLARLAKSVRKTLIFMLGAGMLSMFEDGFKSFFDMGG